MFFRKNFIDILILATIVGAPPSAPRCPLEIPNQYFGSPRSATPTFIIQFYIFYSIKNPHQHAGGD